MNNIIPFKKSIIFKNKIHDITDIFLAHDYKIEEDIIVGEFSLSGRYKVTESSMINEEFYYDIPFSIAIGNRINKNSILLEIEKFDYSFNEDVLDINVSLNMDYEENDFNMEEDISKEMDWEDKELFKEDKIVVEKDEKIEKTVDNLINEVNKNENFITYKVHIVRNDDTIESISSKYNVNIDLIKEYNDINELNIGDKILVPYIYNE